jgi:hypothetical protein
MCGFYHWMSYLRLLLYWMRLYGNINRPLGVYCFVYCFTISSTCTFCDIHTTCKTDRANMRSKVSLVNYNCILRYSPCQFLHTWNLTTWGRVNTETNNPSSPTYQFICKPHIHWLPTEFKQRAWCAILLEYDVSMLIGYRSPLFSITSVEQLGLPSFSVWHETYLSLLWLEWTPFIHQRNIYFIRNCETAVVKNEYRNVQTQLSKLHLHLYYSLPIWQ